MRVLLSKLAIVAFLAAPAVALAAPQTTTGTVKSFSPKQMTLTLDNGTVYMLPKGYKNPGLKAGEKVSITWNMAGKKHEATAVKILQ
ncbi:DUF1344 domain-containing protein [Mycoplana dimorpha]|uniref:Uncharacterized protein DUF1344 n=1 Tax=Mycoplana dimorpha TaxID=28320 RepID=A0A2T5BHW1_MYCDI|nr:DUF1344 domain-containing protein [Mycoplana dimorpha]PTM98569.1 uncharacterized protein DUF1344 [Mycoplana dimorpha]